MTEGKIKVLLAEINSTSPVFWNGVLSEIQDSGIEFIRSSQIPDVEKGIGEKIPDVILLDLTMVEGNRLQVFLNVYKLNPDIPIITVTEDQDRNFAYQTLQEGAKDWLAKERANGYYSLSRSTHYAIWNQIHLKQLRSFSTMVESMAVHKNRDLMPLARQQFQLANKTRGSLIRISRMALLAELEARLAKNPDDLEAFYYRASLLMDLGRTQEGRAAYFEMFGRVTSFASELKGPDSFVMKAYCEAVRYHSDYPMGHVILGDLFRENKNWSAALIEYETALKLQPDCVQAREAIALLPSPLGEKGGAFRVDAGSSGEVGKKESKRDFSPQLSVLLLISMLDENDFFQKLLDPQIFHLNVVVVEFYVPSYHLPPHQLIINGIGDADRCEKALETAKSIIARSDAPVINAPDLVLATKRLDNAVRFSHVAGVITPLMLSLTREELSKLKGNDIIRDYGFVYPFLVRSPGFHTGRYFQMIANEHDWTTAVASLPGDPLLVIQYLDARGSDGKFRKYRVVCVEGHLYPAHVAVSHEWKNHFFSADMANDSLHRDEDEMFLKNFETVLGDRVLVAIQSICGQLALDYGGVDFGLNGDRQVLLFEANTGMTVNLPYSDPRWDYRREPVLKIRNAICEMLLRKAKKTMVP